MLHNQLKITLPDCPYLWDYNNIEKVYSFESDSITQDEFTLLSYSQDIMNFIEDIITNNDNIHFYKIKQKIPQHDNKLWLNFNTVIYKTKNKTSLIFKEQEEEIKWCILTDSPDYVNTKETVKYELNLYTNGDIQPDKTYIQPRRDKILLNDKTRQSASLIRERLMSSYKMNLIGKNTDLLEKQKKIDLSLKDISHVIADRHNQEIDNSSIVINNDMYDLLSDTIWIKKTNNILRFGPRTACKINITHNTTFISIAFNNNNVYITHHIIQKN